MGLWGLRLLDTFRRVDKSSGQANAEAQVDQIDEIPPAQNRAFKKKKETSCLTVRRRTRGQKHVLLGRICCLTLSRGNNKVAKHRDLCLMVPGEKQKGQCVQRSLRDGYEGKAKGKCIPIIRQTLLVFGQQKRIVSWGIARGM